MTRRIPVFFVCAAALLLPLIAGDRFGADVATLLLTAVAAMALNLVTGLAGQSSLGHAALVGAGAYTAGVTATHLGWGFPLTLVAGIAAGVLAGSALGSPSLRLRGQYLALVTIGGGLIFVRFISGAAITGGESGLSDIPGIRFGSYSLGDLGHAEVAALLFSLTLFGVWNLTHSSFGRSLAALKDSEVVAAASGIDIFRTKMTVFLLSSVIAASAGVIQAHTDGFLAPASFGLDRSLFLLIVCIIGGLGRPFGGAIGAAILSAPFLFFPEIGHFQLLLLGPLALATILWMPHGVAGTWRTKKGHFGLGSVRAFAVDAADAEPLIVGPAVTLKATGVSKSFGGVRAVDDVSLEVRPNSIHALIGPNGSGKTTFVNCLTGVLLPDAGAVSIGETDVTGWRPHRVARMGVARTFQSAVALGSLNVAEAIAIGGDPHARVRLLRSIAGAEPSVSMSLVRQAMSLTALAAEPTESAGALSYGQTKRLDLARAVVSSPSILILDEPSAGKNEIEVEELAALLMQLRHLGAAVLVVDHHMGLVSKIADVVTVLDHGKVIASGSSSSVRADPEVGRAFLGAAL